MKKVFIAAAFIAALGLGLTSCNKDKAKCIEMIVHYTDPKTGSPSTSKEYVWQSENQAWATLDSISRTFSNVTSAECNTMPGIGESTCNAMNSAQ